MHPIEDTLVQLSLFKPWICPFNSGDLHSSFLQKQFKSTNFYEKLAEIVVWTASTGNNVEINSTLSNNTIKKPMNGLFMASTELVF